MTRLWILILISYIVYSNGRNDRKSSLTFVIDVTRSMESVRRQVEQHAHGIFDAVVKSNESFIENFVLVTFADTTRISTSVNNVTDTTDRNEFKDSLKLSLVKGGDCPEQSMSGIQTGIENSRPGSTIYVFTDASAKDFDLYENVVDKALKKEIQVVFVLTGRCSTSKYSNEGYEIYEDLARSTSGQVFNLHRDKIGDIIKYIIDSLSTRRILLAVKSFPAGKGHTFTYRPDHATSDTTLVISCQGATLSITGPGDEKLELEKLVDLENVAVVKVRESKIGDHTVTIDCSTTSRVITTAKSDIQFRHGFSGFTPISLNDTTVKPSSDGKTFLSIKPLGNFLPQTVSLLDVFDNVLSNYTMPLKVLDESDNLFITEPFDTPLKMFRIVVVGVNLNHNETIIRIGTTLVEPQNAFIEKPIPKKATISIEKSPKITVEYDTPLQLKCLINAYPKPTAITWEKNGKVLENAVLDFDLPYDFISVHKIKKVNENATYECKAKNSEGHDKQSISVETKLIEEAPIIDKNTLPLHLKEGTNCANMSCKIVAGIPTPNIQWYYNDTVSGVFVEINEARDKENLTFTNINRKQRGSYKCVATNSLGSDTIELTLVVEHAPTVDEDSASTTVKAGDEVTLTCSADGVPEPIVTWSKDNKSLPGTKFVSSSDHRLIFKADLDDSGVYKCHASNKLGSDNKTNIVEVQKSPTLLIRASDPIDAEYGEPLNITCEVLGYPKPDIIWIHTGTNFELESEEEQINSFTFLSYLNIDKITENAKYRCRANNTLGYNETDVTVKTERKPFFDVVESPTDKTVAYNDMAQFNCKVDAHPPADVNWYKNGNILLKDDISVSSDGVVLTIKHMQPDDTGKYMCEAKNINHVKQILFEVKISGLAKPKITKTSKLVQIPEDTDTKLSCRIEEGTPKPTIQWYYSDTVAGTFIEIKAAKDEEDLLLTNVNRKQGGSYKCVAINVVDSDAMESTLVVEYSPTVDKDSIPTIVKAGDEVTLTCSADGVPEPIVTWSKDDKSLPGTKFVSSSDYRLIFKADLDDSGVYKCHASNKLGSDNKTNIVEVQKSPTLLIRASEPIDAEYGKPLNITCEVLGYPKPDITWIHTGTNLKLESEEEQINSYTFLSYLNIDKITENAKYRCGANNTLGYNETDVTIKTERKPFFDVVESPTDKTVAYNDIAQFNCKVDAHPPADVNWYKNGNILLKDDISVSSDGVVLTIKHMQPDDTGKYMCEAKNINHVKQILFEVKISGLAKPKITKTSKLVQIPENTDTKLSCRIEEGTPKPTIQWYYSDTVAGTFIEIKAAKDEEDLLLTNVNRKQGGSYKCVAINVVDSDAMESTLVVEYSPTVDKDSIPTIVKAGDEVTLTCSADGVPEPIVTWSKDDKSLPGTKLVSSSDHRLIFKADLDDSGVYKCHASNKLGSDNKTNIVEVQKSPTLLIRASEPIDAEYGKPLNITCEVLGYPKPDITWIHTGTNLKLESEEEQINSYTFLSYLNIDKITENAKYRCGANNTLGYNETDVTVKTERKPFFDVVESPTDKTVAYNDMAQFNCKVDAHPPADVNWYKNGNILLKDDISVSSDGVVLTIKHMQPDDTGKYMCEAKNINHVKQILFEVKISGLAKPKITKTSKLVQIPENTDTKLSCRIEEGTPKPTIQWYYSDTVAGTFIEIKAAKDEEDLLLTNVNRKQGGSYKCVAINVVDSDAMESTLVVEYSPTVDKDSIPTIVKAGDEVTLTCSADGVPEPIVTWSKDDKSLPGTKLVSSSDHRLIFKADLDDSGVYKCHASNKLGSDNKTNILEVQKSPTLLIRASEPIDAEYGKPLNITCEVLGYPKPDITWIHTGTNLKLESEEEQINSYTFLSYLNIDKITENAKYRCGANNTLGYNETDVTVKTERKPFFDVVESPTDKTVAYNDMAQFNCKVDAHPPADVNWYKNGNILLKDDISVSSDGVVLTIKHMQPDDAGKYMCEAKNINHVKQILFEVKISGLVKPKIQKAINTINVAENGITKISCQIENGIPEPIIQWYYKNTGSGVIVEIKESKDQEELIFKNTKKDYQGTYKCLATNVAGYDEMEVDIIVDYAPTLDGYSEIKTTIAGDKVTLSCLAEGFPEPDVVWTKDDKPLTDSKFIASGDHSLTFNVDIDDRGVYKCSASNKLGTANKTVTIEVEKQPTVVIEGDSKQQVDFDEVLDLKCNVHGYPTPVIRWIDINNLLPISSTTAIVKLPYEYLSILHINKVNKNTTYQCEAKNIHGVSRAAVLVEAVRPKHLDITEEPKNTIIEYNTEGKLNCKVDAYPPAKISWHKGWNLVKNRNGIKISPDGSTLTFKRMQPDQEGKYVCSASNGYSTKTKIALVTISGLVAPIIKDDNKTYAVQAGTTVKIPCSVDGIPEPTVTWTKVGSKSSFATTRDNGFRLNTIASDSGVYTCTASNSLGTATRNVTLNVYTIQVIGHRRKKEQAIYEYETLELTCLGKGRPKPQVGWFFEGTPENPKNPPEFLQIGNTLEINNILYEQRGRYTCDASNWMGGHAKFSYEVDVYTVVQIHHKDDKIRAVVGDKVLNIHCNATGNPPPNHFEWKINGISDTEVSDTLTLHDVTKEYDSYEVFCEAQNDNDERDNFLYKVIVDDYPSLNNPNSTKKIKLGDSALVTCPVPHRKGDYLRWYRDKKKIHDGELYINDAKFADADLYTCRVSDSVKSESANVMLKVESKLRFTNTPVKTIISLGFGSVANLNCMAVSDIFPTVSWSHNGRTISNGNFFHKFKINQANVGKYTCDVTNTIDSISRSFDVSLDECVFKIDPDANKQPLIITQHFSWPSYKYDAGYLYMPKYQSVLLVCQSTSVLNKFGYSYVYGYCNKTGDTTQLEIDTRPYVYTDIQCTEEVKPIVKWTGQSCYSDDSETVKIIYELVGKEIEIYDICIDLSYNIPFYTKQTQRVPASSVPKSVIWFNDRIKQDFDKIYVINEQTHSMSSVLGFPWHRRDGCIFSKRQLVNPLDVFPGVPQRSTFTHLNVVPHWSTCSSKNWDELESRVRQLAQSTSNGLTVWTGTAENLKMKDVDGNWQNISIATSKSVNRPVSMYIWKVVQNPIKQLSLAIIQLNIPDITSTQARKYVKCKDICRNILWMKGNVWNDALNGYTFCCRLNEFEDNFGYRGLGIFGKGMDNPLQR